MSWGYFKYIIYEEMQNENVFLCQKVTLLKIRVKEGNREICREKNEIEAHISAIRRFISRQQPSIIKLT